MKSALGLGLAALFVLGCEEADFGPSGLDLAAMDASADPCVDFYRYACGGWIKDHPVGDNASRAARFFDPYYEALPRLRDIIEEDAAGARNDDDPHAELIGNYYASCMAAPADIGSRDVLRAMLDEIDKVATLEDLAKRVAAQREVGSGSFFQFGIRPDPGNAKQYIAVLDEGAFELADRVYYLDPEYKDLLALYEAHIHAMSALIGGTPIDAQAVIKVETLLAQASLPPEEQRDPVALYNPMPVADVLALSPSFPFQTFFAEAGYPDLQVVNVTEPEYISALENLLQTTPLEDLKAYIRWQLLQDRSPNLDQAFLDEDFAFWSNFTGQSEPPPRWFSCYNATLSALGHAVARPYVARYFKEESKETTSAMVQRSRAAFRDRLTASSWLDDPTRQEAIAKLDAMVAKVGYPEKGPEYDGLVFGSGSYLGNAINYWNFWQSRARQMLSEPVDRARWNLAPITVNAIYTASANDVTLPAVLLTAPFLMDNAEAANFGALGAVIGHEMGHGMDDKGSQYDGDGTLRDWWSPHVLSQYGERAQCIVDQFDGYEALPGEYVNGDLTQGENIADLGGLVIAHDALFDGSDDPKGGDGFTADQVFFISYAQTRCENVRGDLQSQWLLTDPHAPSRFRVNGPLSNLPAFREAFSCSDGDKMVREDTCELW